MQRNKTKLGCGRAWSQGKEIYTPSNRMKIILGLVSILVQKGLGDFAARTKGELTSPALCYQQHFHQDLSGKPDKIIGEAQLR